MAISIHFYILLGVLIIYAYTMFIVIDLIWHVVKSIADDISVHITVKNINYFNMIIMLVCALISLISFIYANLGVVEHLIYMKISSVLNPLIENTGNNGGPNLPPNNDGTSTIVAASVAAHNSDDNNQHTANGNAGSRVPSEADPFAGSSSGYDAPTTYYNDEVSRVPSESNPFATYADEPSRVPYEADPFATSRYAHDAGANPAAPAHDVGANPATPAHVSSSKKSVHWADDVVG